MFKIDRNTNTIIPLEQTTFTALGFREREHLQEWIAKYPNSLGEELLIIQKEFAGFDKTSERLDLLALDKQGSLVIIENKRDDSGKDVVWQSLKYASYCSGLSASNIKEIYQDYLNSIEPGTKAEEKLCDFMEVTDFDDITFNKGVTQRIIMIAGDFRNEVTSTVLWLLNYNLRIQCMKVTPFAMGDDLFLNVEQIIPTKDAEEYMIGMAEKAQDDVTSAKEEKTRHHLRKEFWAKLIPAMNALILQQPEVQAVMDCIAGHLDSQGWTSAKHDEFMKITNGGNLKKLPANMSEEETMAKIGPVFAATGECM